ncbi:MAG: thiol-disulfide oxidoreductase DCC family protein [Bacteroidetes bacterium]|nr:thiol-disulfide oxidoreductase DCC family protein [Bacteroidota bacterium]
MPVTEPVIFFDGICNLCNGFVQFIIRRDYQCAFRFASLQSEAAARLLPPSALSNDQRLSSVMLLAGHKIYYKSEAVLQIARILGGGWKFLLIFYALPRPLRDLLYDAVAYNRYRLFGKRNHCMIPTPELQHRFIEA